MTEKPAGHEHTKRDAEILLALGGFLIVLAIPVFIGTFFAGDWVARAINLMAGGVVFVIGALMVWRGIWTRRHLG